MNSVVRVYNVGQVLAGGAGGASTYPLGATTVGGVYAAEHAIPTPPASNASNDHQTYTVSVAPAEHKCTCPACMGLSRLLDTVGGADPFVSAIPVA
jgi:hypothetical protein